MRIVKITKLNVVDGHIFRVNQEYELCREVVRNEWCNCSSSGSKPVIYYEIAVNGRVLQVHKANAVIIEKPMVGNVLSPEEAYHARAMQQPDSGDWNELRTYKISPGNQLKHMTDLHNAVNNIPM